MIIEPSFRIDVALRECAIRDDLCFSLTGSAVHFAPFDNGTGSHQGLRAFT